MLDGLLIPRLYRNPHAPPCCRGAAAAAAATRESLDGFVIGALGAIAFTAAATLTRMAPQFATGPTARIPADRSASFSPRPAFKGVALPLTAAAAGRIGRRGPVVHPAHQHQPTTGDRAAGGEFPCGAGPFATLGLTESLPFFQGLHVGLHLVDRGYCIAGLEDWRAGQRYCTKRRTRRIRMQHVLCPHCDHVVPETAFCPNCGVATRAASRTSRAARRRPPEAPVVRPGYAVPADRTRRCRRLTPRTPDC